LSLNLRSVGAARSSGVVLAAGHAFCYFLGRLNRNVSLRDPLCWEGLHAIAALPRTVLPAIGYIDSRPACICIVCDQNAGCVSHLILMTLSTILD
jgi:hypothetical protein